MGSGCQRIYGGYPENLQGGHVDSILIVDDEPDLLTSLKDVLAQPGLEVLTARSGLEGLALLAQHEVRLILTDYRMPGMDGLEFIRLARKAQKGVPTIMVTAYPDPILAARALKEYGIGLILAKPFELDYLIGVVSSVLSRKKPLPASTRHPPTAAAS